MKVHELIQILKAQNQDLDVVVSTYSCGEVSRTPLFIGSLSVSIPDNALIIDAEDN